MPERRWKFKSLFRSAACCLILSLSACLSPKPPSIAVIPRTTGTELWEPVHAGAESAAMRFGARIYWNAPTLEDNVEGQISLVDRVIENSGVRGLVLAPDQALALITPVRRAMASGMPVVVIGSPLPIPAGHGLSYVLEDDCAAGRLAAQRVAQLVQQRKGTVAIIGIDPDIAALTARARSVELYLVAHDPGIHVVRKFGSFNVLHEQQVAKETMVQNPNLRVVVALNWIATRSALAAIAASGKQQVRVIGFDPDEFLSFDNAFLDSVLMQDTRSMGADAVQMIASQWNRQSTPSTVVLQPVLATRENYRSQNIRQLQSIVGVEAIGMAASDPQ